MKLEFILPQNRAYSGYFLGIDETGKVLCHGRALGKADNGLAIRHNNPDRDPTKPYGDTPRGEYYPVKAVMYARESDKFGKGHIALEGKTGQAVAAVEGGRTGLLIHAGRDYTDGRLVPTYGCLRVSPNDFDRIVKAAAGGFIDVVVREET